MWQTRRAAWLSSLASTFSSPPALLAILVFEQPLVGQVLCGLTCLQELLYTRILLAL